MLKILSIVFLVQFFSISLLSDSSDLDQVWQKSFGGDKDDAAYGVASTSDGGFVAVGRTRSLGEGKTDAIAVKVGANGKILWNREFGKKRKDIFKAVVETSDKFIVATGNSKSYSKDGSYDLFAVKLDQDGKSIWQKSFGGEAKDYATSICSCDNGAVVLAGTTKSFGKGSYDFFVVKLDENGSILWNKTYGGEDLDIANAISKTSDGGYIIAGETESFGADSTDYYIVKIDANGKEEWTKRIGGKKADSLYDAVELSDGYALVGETRSYDSDKRDLSILKIDKSGELLYHKLYGLKNHEYARSVEIRRNGNLLVAGVTKSMGKGRADFYILELNAYDGELIWANTFGGKKNDYARGMVKTKDGEFIVVGDSNSFSEDGFNIHMIRLGKK